MYVRTASSLCQWSGIFASSVLLSSASATSESLARSPAVPTGMHSARVPFTLNSSTRYRLRSGLLSPHAYNIASHIRAYVSSVVVVVSVSIHDSAKVLGETRILRRLRGRGSTCNAKWIGAHIWVMS
ncbi:hypothetical protein BC826DRAFT_605605 [Russula brevipes]|nr:hypothetical protein BC826DRAFT_605605 [Russula brevipes]